MPNQFEKLLQLVLSEEKFKKKFYSNVHPQYNFISIYKQTNKNCFQS